jgi:hypothetical protein
VLNISPTRNTVHEERSASQRSPCEYVRLLHYYTWHIGERPKGASECLPAKRADCPPEYWRV